MATGFKVTAENKRLVDRVCAAALGGLALLVYFLTVARYVYPGESAALMACYTGAETLTLPLHPIWGGIVKWLSGIPIFDLPLRLNLFSATCTALSVVLLYKLVSYVINEIITEEHSIDYAPTASVFAGVVTAVGFMFALPVWLGATRLQYQSFDFLMLLFAASLVVWYARTRWIWLLWIFALLYGAGIVESVIFITMSPVFLLFLIRAMWRNKDFSVVRLGWLGILVAVGLSLFYFSARNFFQGMDCTTLEMGSVSDVVVKVWKNHFAQLKARMPHFKGLFMLIMGVVPWLAMIFASFQALNNERTWSQYMLHIALTVMAVLGLVNVAVSPWEVMRPLGQLPILSYAMIASVAGYCCAYWYLLISVRSIKPGVERTRATQVAGEWLGLLLAYPLAGIVVLASVVNAVNFNSFNGSFADHCAGILLDKMGERIWLVTDGMLDPHLQLLAQKRGKELNLICLQKDLSRFYLHELSELVEERGIFDEQKLKQMQNTLSLGVLPFLQDWMASDNSVSEKLAIFSVPDLWYTARMTPIPNYIFFEGRGDFEQLRNNSPIKEYQKFWQEMDKVLWKDKSKRAVDPVTRLRHELRRHLGFIANNLGVALEEVENDDDAYAIYNYVHSTLDPSNVSVMFNRFEMARRGSRVARADRERIEREMREFVSKVKHQYSIWSLSRYYGYVRSPEIFARLGWGWAMSGQYGAALDSLRRAIDLLPSESRLGAMQSMAQIYALADDKSKTAAVYQDIIKNDPTNRGVMLGLARVAMRDGAMSEAREWLEKAASTDDTRGALGVEWAAIHLMNSDLPKARIALQETTDLQPQNLQAWAMLAMIQLRQDESDQVEKLILPRMESVAGTTDNFYIQITRAQVYLLKGESANFKRMARESFMRAAMLRPDVPSVKDMVLQLDIALNDKVNAELHARQVLRANRKHALANYVMGSLRLQEQQYGEAEDFLRRSVESSPSAASLNDLAEVLRRIRKLDDAERYARDSVELNAGLYVAWETLASILMDNEKNLSEAEQAIKRALELSGDDQRVMMTQARIMLKKGEIEQARVVLHKVRSRQSELSRFEQEELAALLKSAAPKGR